MRARAGWVEFEDKKVARAVAASRNGQPVGGKKSSYYHDDLWCMLYLPKFKWHKFVAPTPSLQPPAPAKF